jgi:3-hydroxyacyl-[acyl-carrier-protein] dehydratase
MSDTTRPEQREIEAAIPHRPPFLFVDRIVESSEEELVAEWTPPADAEWFTGHYPGRPIVPGVLLSEHVFQTAAILVSRLLGGLDAGDLVPVLTKIEEARFRRVVRPGETLICRVKIGERVGAAWYMSGDVRCEGKSVLRIRYVMTNASVEALGEGPSG